MVRTWYGHDTDMIRTWYGHGTDLILSRIDTAAASFFPLRLGIVDGIMA
ncbi:MAG: hypothetical protein LBD35_05685 [Prevotellaceae bacterium]|nr:hypothetical protein [Prevotellaceae bacterium]